MVVCRCFRVQVSRKSDVPYFGPLYNEAIVGQEELPGLVRATALSASRAKRSVLAFYQQYYEERSRFIETVVKNHKKPSTFEEFTSQIYEPVPSTDNAGWKSSGLQSLEDTASSTGSNQSSTLAALLDSSHRLAQSSHDTDHEHEISPRPLKKLIRPSYKKPSPTPPDSPTSRKPQFF